MRAASVALLATLLCSAVALAAPDGETTGESMDAAQDIRVMNFMPDGWDSHVAAVLDNGWRDAWSDASGGQDMILMDMSQLYLGSPHDCGAVDAWLTTFPQAGNTTGVPVLYQENDIIICWRPLQNWAQTVAVVDGDQIIRATMEVKNNGGNGGNRKNTICHELIHAVVDGTHYPRQNPYNGTSCVANENRKYLGTWEYATLINSVDYR